MFLEVVFIFLVAGMGYHAGFITGVESEKEDIEKRSVPMGNCTLVFQ
jgi:hypothetical protein